MADINALHRKSTPYDHVEKCHICRLAEHAGDALHTKSTGNIYGDDHAVGS